MLNYIKSEWYRIWHTKEIYVTTGMLAGVTLLMNLVLFISNRDLNGFRYGTTSFSLSMLVSGISVLLIAGSGIVIVLFSGDKKNGVLKNAIANGISREKIFLGKCIVGTVVAICSMIVVLGVYIGSAVFLLDNGIVDEVVWIALKGVMSVLLMAIASLILTTVLNSIFERDGGTIFIWYIIMCLIPSILELAGRKVAFLKSIADWMPWNYLSNEVVVNMSGWECLWETPEGLAKCVISGVAGIVIFLISGIVLCRVRDV